MSQSLSSKQLDDDLLPLLQSPHWYVAFSGGVDSTALLHLVNSWRKARQGAPGLTALHINHGIQAQSGEWENHCAWICRFLGVPFLSLQADVSSAGQGLEAAARDARYGLFEQQLEEGEVLFLAHHQDDQVETFFLRLLRGAGLEGLSSMPRERALGEGKLCRPLLDVPRSMLERYTVQQGLRCIDDPSNEDISLNRNYLRREVLPLIEGRWPGYRQTVTRAGEHLAGVSRALQQSVEPLTTLFSVVGDPGISAAELAQLDAEEAARALRHWLRQGGYLVPDQAPLQEFVRQLREASRQARPQLDCTDYRLQRYQDGVYLLPETPEFNDEVLVFSPGEVVDIAGIGRVSLQRADEEGFWLAADEELELRFRGGGERCHPVQRRRSSTLKKLLQEIGLPPWWRDRLPLLYLEDELLAAGALGPCRSSRWCDEGHKGEVPWQLSWEPLIAGGFD